MDKRRGAELIAVIGTNNTGKSAITELLIQKYNKKRDALEMKGEYPENYNKLIVYDPQHRFRKYLRKGDHVIDLTDENWADDILKYRASMVVLDDYKELLDGDTMPKQLLRLISGRAEFGIDLILVMWHPMLIIPRLAMFITKFFILKVNSKPKEFIARIQGNEELVGKIQIALDKEFGSYSEQEYSNLFPNFPFIYYDSQKNFAKKVNFKKS
jgi:hypothetical protein